MTKRIFSFLLCLVLLLACISVSLAEPTEVKTDSGVFALSSVRSKMMSDNPNIKILKMSVDMLDNLDYKGLTDEVRDNLNMVAGIQWTASTGQVDVPGMGTVDTGVTADSYTLSTLQTQYDSLHDQYKDLYDGVTQKNNAKKAKEFKSMQEQLVQAGETMFVTYKSLEVQYEGLERNRDALGRTISELEIRKKYGQVSDLNLAQVRSGKAQLEAGMDTLKMNMDNLLMQMKMMYGMDVGSTLKLGSVPEITQAKLSAMKLETDLASAKNASCALVSAKDALNDAEKQFKEDKSDYAYSSSAINKMLWAQAQITWQTAQNTYQSTVDNFEVNFRNLYSTVNNKAAVLKAAEAALTAAEKDYSANKVKYKYGQVSLNTVKASQDSYNEALASVTTAKYDLFTAYNNYNYAVKYGIIN